MSNIILVLLDSRCPPLHLPPFIASYHSLPGASTDTVSDTIGKSKMTNVIIVLTKVDISGPAHAAAWTSYLNTQYPGVPVVPVEAYAPKTADPGGKPQGRVRYKPHIGGTFRERLVHVLKDLHARVLIPPDRVRQDKEKEKDWISRMRADIDWERVMNATAARVERIDDSTGPNSGNPEDMESKFLTVGLIGMSIWPFFGTGGTCLHPGQPNVGKLTLLNALFGTTMVWASCTPGKVKVLCRVPWTLPTTITDKTLSDFVLDTRCTTSRLPWLGGTIVCSD